MKTKHLLFVIGFAVAISGCHKNNDLIPGNTEEPVSENLSVNKIPNAVNTIIANNTYLYPSGGSSAILFKGGTNVTFDTYGKVLIGTVVNNTYLYPAGGSSTILFKASTEVTFVYGQNAKVEKGTLVNNTYLYPSGGSSTILFQANTQVTFVIGENAKVRRGILQNNTYLYPSGG